MGIFRSLVLFMVLAAFLSLGVACSSNESPQQASDVTKESQPAAESKEEKPVAATQERLPEPAPQKVAQEEPPAAVPKTLALTGTVAKDGEKTVLSTDLGDYIIEGQDLSEMVGKVVNVTGAVEEVNGEYTINVISFSQD